MEIPIKTEFCKVFIQGENWKLLGFCSNQSKNRN